MIAIARELTKVYEEVLHFTLEEAVRHYKENTPRGEFVVILEGLKENPLKRDFSGISIEEHLKEYLLSGMSKKEAVKQVAKDRNLSKSQVYPFSVGLDIDNN